MAKTKKLLTEDELAIELEKVVDQAQRDFGITDEQRRIIEANDPFTVHRRI